MIKNIADLYDITFEKIVGLERFAEKSAQNVIDGLQKSKNIPFERVLFGLGIKYVGQTVAEKLAHHFKNIDSLAIASKDELTNTPEIGEKIAESVQAWFANQNNRAMIERLKLAGLQFKVQEKEVVLESSRLQNMSFVISGTFKNFSREELQEKIIANGGKILSGVSGKLQFLVAGNEAGPSKLEKAQKLGVNIINEEKIMEMLG